MLESNGRWDFWAGLLGIILLEQLGGGKIHSLFSGLEF